MANIALAWENLVDDGTMSASGFITRASPSRLQNKHIARKWRVNSTSAYVVCDLGASHQFDVVGLVGLSGTAAPTLRVRVSSADSSGAAGDVHDSGSLTDIWDARYLPAVYLLSTPVNGRYVRIDITDTGIDYIEAGRMLVMLKSQFTINMQPGFERSWNDPSIRTIGRSGLTFNDIRDPYRTLSLTMEFVSEDERWDIMEEIDVLLGSHGDLLVLTDPASTELPRDTVWGYMESMTPVVEPIIIQGDLRFRKTYQIRERL